jgi:drug/metabolite transporter (DMT)-like permease
VGSALYGGITVGGRVFANLGFSLLEIAIVGGMFGATLALPVLWWKPEWRPVRRDLGLFVGFGVMGTILQTTQFLGVVLGVPIAIVALLLYTQPVWTVVLGRLWLREPVTWRKVAALLLAGIGVLLLIGPTDTSESYPALGVVAAAIAGFMLSLWVTLARISALRGNHAVTTTFGYQGSTTLGLLATWAVLAVVVPGDSLWRLDVGVFAANWQVVAIYTLLVNVLPSLLVTWGMKGLEASIGGFLLLLEPVAAAGGAWWLFGESLAGPAWVGGAFILASNAVLVARRTPGRGESA